MYIVTYNPYVNFVRRFIFLIYRQGNWALGSVVSGRAGFKLISV